MLTDELLGERLAASRDVMSRSGVDALLLSVGRDLPYLTGYDAMPLERLTMLVVRPTGQPQLIVPALEAPRVVPRPSVFDIVPWSETQDPLTLVARACDGAQRIAIGDQTWARFLVDLLPMLPSAQWRRAVDVVGPLRIVKDSAEISALAAAAAAVDTIAADLQAGRIPLVGRTEAAVSADLSRRILEAGHERVNFAIVAAGENAASPHHHPGERVIGEGEIVLCDFGGTMDGYCSDITRCVVTGEIPDEIAAAWSALMEAQEAGVMAAQIGAPCADVDRAARSVLEAAGYGEYFVHRTGHGIGMEEHEDPYMVETDLRPLVPGHAFSVEPGIYVPGRWGMRLEDIVVATEHGPRRLNTVDHRLFSVG